ncbi:MAG TPA: hypothetical protein PLA87_20865 [Pseudomonadota bacterium]|nr:hypothetical protein [Pseudomonadota bacterium]
MKQVLAAAITGVYFGAVLGISIYRMAEEPTPPLLVPVEVKAVPAPPEPPRIVAPPPRPTVEIPVVSECAPDQLKIDGKDPDEVLTIAQTCFVNGDYRGSIATAQKVIKENPVRAWRIIGTSACNLKDVKLASTAFKRLDSAGRQYLIYACQRQGIQSSGASFVLATE